MAVKLRTALLLSLLFLFTPILNANTGVRDTIFLSGNWQYRLSEAPPEIPGEGVLVLPNTLDNAHRSVYSPPSDNTTQLRREFSFSGNASYSKRINVPESWRNKSIELTLERTKPSTVFIDGIRVGSNSRISSPQRYNLSRYLTPGAHTIAIVVNNSDSLPPIVNRSSHAASESTQTNWNGILGDILLEAKNPFHIKEAIIREQENLKEVDISVEFSSPAPHPLTLSVFFNSKEESIKINKGATKCSFSLPVTSETPLWNARHPNLLTIDLYIKESQGEILDKYSFTTGLRVFKNDGTSFQVNGNPVFLRGTVNAAVFPLSAYAPIDEDSWQEYFNLLKEYGLNHVRFHSWTPPEAAFRAADKTGIYLQIELPLWGEIDRDMIFTNRFLKEELEGIIEEYSRHPSWVMFSTGNELWGDISLMGEYMTNAKSKNPRILTTYGSNVYLGMNGEIGGEDFIVASKIGDGTENFIRGSMSFADSPSGGHFNSSYPSSNKDFSDATAGLSVPTVAHETGQYQIYPDFSIIDSYTGILKPDNLEEFKKRAIDAGTFRKNKIFAEASGKWAAKLYKAEMEMAQRSSGLAGFQLFGFQDYPGQGTALVGIFTPLLQSKNLITSETWRQSCDDLVIMAEFPAFSFYENEIVEIPVVTANFTDNPDEIGIIKWSTEFQNGEINAIKGLGVMENESIYLRLPALKEPQKFSLKLKLDGEKISNSYDFMVYPHHLPDIEKVAVTSNLTEALILLDQGERVILSLDSITSAEASLDPLFINDFWNYRMYRTICDEMGLKPSPGTLGLYINKNHNSLAKFPTELHTDWQWFPILANSRPLIIDRLPKDIDPIVEVIDNVERNFRLALMMECNVGKGKLMILAADVNKFADYPEGKWLLQSIKEYMAGKDCKPSLTLTPDQVVNLVTKPSLARKVKELKNETYNSHWD